MKINQRAGQGGEYGGAGESMLRKRRGRGNLMGCGEEGGGGIWKGIESDLALGIVKFTASQPADNHK